MAAKSKSCGAMGLHAHLVATSERYARERRWLEHQRVLMPVLGSRAGKAGPPLATSQSWPASANAERGLIHIPVVVHVVYHSDEDDISREQIESQIACLNRDFQLLNADLWKLDQQPTYLDDVGNAGIAFELAKRDPAGLPTDGIIRSWTPIEAFPRTTVSGIEWSILIDRELKVEGTGQVAWPRDQYLNIWVCNMRREPLGYSTFPGAAPEIDGVAIDHRCFGTTGTAEAPFDGGRTAVHEIGHWLDLLHIWGDDSDGCECSDNVEDTPNQEGPNQGVPLIPTVSCGNSPDGDMCRNYMDRVDDSEMVMFTIGQVDRMSNTLARARASLLSSPALEDPEPIDPAPSPNLVALEATAARAKVFDGVTWVSRSSWPAGVSRARSTSRGASSGRGAAP